MSNKDSFETSLKKLEALVEKLEAPDLSLEQSLKFFEEGVKLSRICENKLQEAQGKIEKLTEHNNIFHKEPLTP